MLDTPLKKAIRTTGAHLKRLQEMGMLSVRDMLLYFPARYTDEREISRIAEIKIGEVNVVRAIVKSVKSRPSFRGRMAILTALLSDETGSVEAVWFNQPYLAKTLQPQSEVIISGKAKYDAKRGKLTLQNPVVELIKAEQIHTARIVPVYHETELAESYRGPGKISSKWIREKLFPLLPFAEYFPEFLPKEIIKENGFMKYSEAIRNAHFPETEERLDEAKKRLAFDELFLLQLAALHRRALWRKAAAAGAKKISADWELIKKFTHSLPWALTNSQKKAIYEIITDLGKPFPMSRLLEGDTGSGKTVVAAAAILSVVSAGFQACLLAPTEILARQHMKTLEAVLRPFEIKPALLSGSLKEKEKKEIAEKLKLGSTKLIIGTHALLQQHVGFKNLGLAIIDEQHRFGVKQREMLKTYGGPHILSLTATPIPRTLALILYGDQDLSLLDEMPPSRQKVITRIVPEVKRREAYRWIEREIEKGRQAFIIFPLIEESELLQVKAATQEWQRLQQEIFPQLKIGLLHGQLAPLEKDEQMSKFANGKLDILVSTAVVEVGVDVPNATIMMIEGAERFGLAQLHQFRGRVGRGSEQSYCFLFPTVFNPLTLKRLHTLEKYHSGFKLAEVDLELRGPGEVYGTAQSGIPDLKMASLSDRATIKASQDCAITIIEKDPQLQTYPELLARIAEQENIAIDY